MFSNNAGINIISYYTIYIYIYKILNELSISARFKHYFHISKLVSSFQENTIGIIQNSPEKNRLISKKMIVFTFRVSAMQEFWIVLNCAIQTCSQSSESTQHKRPSVKVGGFLSFPVSWMHFLLIDFQHFTVQTFIKHLKGHVFAWHLEIFWFNLTEK